MYGFEAISAHNGWAIAITGVLITITGLAVLAFVISQLHKVATLLESGFNKQPNQTSEIKARPQARVVPKPPVLDLGEARRHLEPLTAGLGDSFELQQLYELANGSALPHVHLSIRSLRDSGIIIPAGDGRFTWQH
ncbi:MAG: hypothetical protein U5R30_10635 [Deltaproteobacteria bacterium]|nr:hypothetical protein [Deltaproteobacteria bacterium]